MTVAGPGSSWINTGTFVGLNIGSFGTGTLTIANGGRVIDTTPLVSNIGNSAGSRGTVTVTGAGSLWTDFAGIRIGNLGTGTLTIAEGGIVAAPSVAIAANAGSTGTLNIGAAAGALAVAPGTLSTPSVAFGGVGTGTGTINFNHTVQPTTCLQPGDQRRRHGHRQCARRQHHPAQGPSTPISEPRTWSMPGTLRAGAPNTFSSKSAAIDGRQRRNARS